MSNIFFDGYFRSLDASGIIFEISCRRVPCTLMRAVKWENANERARFLQSGRVSPKEPCISAAQKY